MALRFFLCTILLSSISLMAFSQQDTAVKKVTDTLPVPNAASKKVVEEKKNEEDTASKKWGPAKRAAVYSAILPGAGQAYNRKYWKMPLVYGALAIPAYTFSYNLTWFNRSRIAYNYTYNVVNNPNYSDPDEYARIHPRLKGAVDRKDLNGLQQYRNGSRKYVDYSALIFILLWGLNVVDASVDGHLKDFNVTDDLSLQIKSGYMPVGNTTGVGLVLSIGKNHVNSSR